MVSLDNIYRLFVREKEIMPESQIDRSGWDSLKILREITGLREENDIVKMLLVYTETMEMLDRCYGHWETKIKMDWAIARAMSPEWFGEELTTRINNTMLVSALLVTVTSASLFAPPQYDHLNDVNKNDAGLRVYFYVNAIANLLFITSIISGVCFVENAMSRAYCDLDKFVLIIEQYSYKNLSQYTAVLGAFLFIVSLFISIWKTYHNTDCLIFCIIGGVTMCYLLKIQLLTINQAAIRQAYRVAKFQPLVDCTGRIKDEFYPKPDESGKEKGDDEPTRLTNQEIKDMFVAEMPLLKKN